MTTNQARLLVCLVAALLALILAAPAAADDGGVVYNRYGREVGKFSDGDLVCYVIFAVRDGDRSILQCYKREQ